MIITNIRLEEKQPMMGSTGSWPLPVVDFNLDPSAGLNGYILKEAQGLDPPNLSSIVEGFDINGNPVMGSIPDKRQIVFRIGLNPRLGQSYGSLRDALYKYINRTVLVDLMNGSLIIAQAQGYIQVVESVHFSNQPNVQMTVECEDGEFLAPFAVDIPLSDLTTLEPIINYEDGTAPTGFEFQFNVTANHTGFTISSPANDNNEFNLNYPFLIGDVVTVSTQPKDKRVTLLRAAVTYDIAGYVNSGAVWPKLYPGVNAFEWTFEASWMTWVYARYIPRYWGV